MSKLLFCFADRPQEFNTSMWGAIIPADSINRLEGHKAATIHLDAVLGQNPQAIAATKWAQIVIIERNFWGKTIGLVRALKKAGKLVVAWFDDAYDKMTSTNPSFPHWQESLSYLPDGSIIDYGPGYLNEWINCLKEFHAFHTPSQVLTDDWLEVNPRGYVVNNYPDYNWPSWTSQERKERRPFLIGWGGGASHFDSFNDSKIIPALRQLCQKYSFIQIVIISSDRRLSQLLDLPEGQLLYSPGVPLEIWPRLIPQFTIGFVPLAGGYDDRRSYLKILELGAQGVPWVAADKAPYRLSPRKPGKGYPGGLLAKDTVESWVNCLSKLMEDEAFRYQLSGEGRKWARAQNVDNHIYERLQLYERLLEELRAGKLGPQVAPVISGPIAAPKRRKPGIQSQQRKKRRKKRE